MQRRSVLILSPSPPIPRDYGNRNRVFQTIGFFKNLNFDVSFLLYPFDEDWARRIPPYYKDLVDMCDYFSVVPNSRRLHQPAAGVHHQIDEWWDETIGQQLEWLFARKKFDVFLVNYTFFSAAFARAPRDVLKVLDTHDIFSGRREVFERHGVAPEFFYTTPAEEAVAFNRADCVIAIKPSEAEFIRSQTAKTVVSLPYWDSTVQPAAQVPRETRGPLKFSHDRPLVLGFIGARNSVNSANMARFLKLFQRYVLLHDLPVEIVVAGNVCNQLPDYPFLKKLGRIPSVEDFYRGVDAVISPLEFSTGIKIKVGEALAWGLPILATDNAFDGFRKYHWTQSLQSVAAVCDAIADIATNVLALEPLRQAARRSATAAAKAQGRGFVQLRAFITENTRRILVFADRPFWRRDTFVDEQIAQAIEYLSAIERVVVLLDHEQPLGVDALHCEIEWERVRAADVADFISEFGVLTQIAGFVWCGAEARDAQASVASLVPHSWSLRFAPASGKDRAGKPRLARLEPKPDKSDIAVSVCRYLPLVANTTRLEDSVAIYIPEQPSEWEKIAFDAAAALCRLRSLDYRECRVGPSFPECPKFFHELMQDAGARGIVIGPRGWQYAIAQINDYRGAATLLVSEDGVVPEKLDHDGRPSLVAAVEDFLDAQVSATLLGGPNAGWGELWDILAARH